MATCPKCGESSRDDPTLMSYGQVVVTKPAGTYSLSGAQEKVAGWVMWQLECRCGWRVVGLIEGDHFIHKHPEGIDCFHCKWQEDSGTREGESRQ